MSVNSIAVSLYTTGDHSPLTPTEGPYALSMAFEANKVRKPIINIRVLITNSGTVLAQW